MSSQFIETGPFITGCNGHFPPIVKETNSLVDPVVMISLLPEAEAVEEVVQKFFYHYHQDKKLSLYSDYFRNIIELNATAFKDHSMDESATILFNSYRNQSLEKICFSENYVEVLSNLKSAVKKCFSDLWSDKVLDVAILKINRATIRQWHRGLPEFAIAKIMNVTPGQIDLSNISDEYEHVALKLPKNTVFQ